MAILKKNSKKRTSTGLKLLLPTPLKQKLYGYAKEGKPVLLHGRDDVDRVSLISMVHLVFSRGHLETFTKVDYCHEDGIAVLEKLTKITDYDERSGAYKQLLHDDGTLFIDNLRCSESNSEDKDYYERLAIEIEKSRKPSHWLVVYTRDHTRLPKLFQEQFKLVSLSGKNKGGKTAKLRGTKKHYVPKKDLIPFIKQNMKYLQSPKGGELSGGVLIKKIKEGIYKRFNKEYGEKAKYKKSTVSKMISQINTGKF